VYTSRVVGRFALKEQTVPQSQLRSKDFLWKYWFVVPIYPYSRRRTLRREVVPQQVWTFDQVQGIFYVIVPIRMTVVRLEAGGLLVYAPVAPTPECVRLVRELEDQYGEVKYIILPTTSAVEHKVFVPAFARKFPTSQVYVAPYQWSFPVNLPLSWLGFPPKRTHVLPADSRETPFASQFDYAILENIELGVGQFEEVAFYDRSSRTLLVTDTVVQVPEVPPEIVQLDPFPLLFHGRDRACDPILDTPQNRQKGWQRSSLFTLYFSPSTLATFPWKDVFRNARNAPDRSPKAYFGLYPFDWQSGWETSFQALRSDGKPIVAPILQTLILNRAPELTLKWVNRVAKWNFERIIPAHFHAPITAKGDALREAYAFLDPQQDHSLLPKEDFEVLKQLDQVLVGSKAVPPAKQ
jgi:hypothetical protein